VSNKNTVLHSLLYWKKAHDWAVDQIADLFRTTHKAKTQQVASSRGQQCGNIELAGYLANAAGLVPSVLDLHIVHERWGSRTYPSINGHLHYPHDVDRPLNEAATDKIRAYRAHYHNRPSNAISMVTVANVSGVFKVNLCVFYFYKIVEMYTCSNTALGRKRKNRWFCFFIFKPPPLFFYYISFLPNMCV
jgi:hypothetical protein